MPAMVLVPVAEPAAHFSTDKHILNRWAAEQSAAIPFERVERFALSL